MAHKLVFTLQAADDLNVLERTPNLAKRLKAVRKALAYLETNLRHPSLNTHAFTSMNGANGEKVYEAYAENKTPAAYRIFWHYGPDKSSITIIAITAHP